MSRLFFLSDTVISLFLCQWLWLPEVVKFESALVSTDEKISLSNILQNGEIAYQGTRDIATLKLLEWIGDRKIKRISRLTFHSVEVLKYFLDHVTATPKTLILLLRSTDSSFQLPKDHEDHLVN